MFSSHDGLQSVKNLGWGQMGFCGVGDHLSLSKSKPSPTESIIARQ